MKFHTHQRLVHVKTRHLYQVLATPDLCMIENGAVPAYAYRSMEQGYQAPIWVRPQAEMEDGRFVDQDEFLNPGITTRTPS